MEPLVPRALFGGAMTIATPARFTDISDFRPIPDHQECFTDANLDQSLIVEILEHQADVANNEAAAFFFDDLSQQNAAEYAKVISTQQLGSSEMPGLPDNIYKCLVVGEQAISKGRQDAQALNKVHVILCVVRLPEYGSDVLLTLNTPIFISELSAAAKEAGSGYKDNYLTAPQLFQQILANLQINDYKVFGN